MTPNMKPPAFQFYADENGFQVGQPPRGCTPSAKLNTKRFLVDTMTLNCSEVGSLVQRVCQMLATRDFDTLRRLPFIDRVFVGTQKRPHIPNEVRKKVLSVGVCARCGATDDLEVDHVIPYSKGGAHEEDNFQCLCSKCNRRKGAQL